MAEREKKITLPIKKQWFDMILSGQKKQEYREIKPFYTKRLCNMFDISEKSLIAWFHRGSFQNIDVIFKNGYSKTSPSFQVPCMLFIGTGKEEWGAEKDTEYFIFQIQGKCKLN